MFEEKTILYCGGKSVRGIRPTCSIVSSHFVKGARYSQNGGYQIMRVRKRFS